LDRFGHFCGGGLFRWLFFDHQRSVTAIAGPRRSYAPGRLLTAAICTESAHRWITAKQLLVDPPELLASPVEVVLRRLKGLDRRRDGLPPTADRLDHGQRLQRVRCVAQALMGPVQLLALLLRQLRRLATNLHVTPLMRGRAP